MAVAAPSGVFDCRFLSAILKNYLAQRGPDKATERPHQKWDTSNTKFDKISDQHENDNFLNYSYLNAILVSIPNHR
jgi:hypothetical protein